MHAFGEGLLGDGAALGGEIGFRCVLLLGGRFGGLSVFGGGRGGAGGARPRKVLRTGIDALTAVLPPGRLIVNDHEWSTGLATIELRGSATPDPKGEAPTRTYEAYQSRVSPE